METVDPKEINKTVEERVEENWGKEIDWDSVRDDRNDYQARQKQEEEDFTNWLVIWSVE